MLSVKLCFELTSLEGFRNGNTKMYFYKRELTLLVYLTIKVIKVNCRNSMQTVQKKKIKIIIQIKPPIKLSIIFCPSYVRGLLKDVRHTICIVV